MATEEEKPPSATPLTQAMPAAQHRLRLTCRQISGRVWQIDELDLLGFVAESPSRRFRLFWRDGNDAGTVGGHRREGPGQVLLLEDGQLRARIRVERPNDGKVADEGSFIVNDWGFGDGLHGRFLAFSADGARLIDHQLEANLVNNGIARNGTIAVCQTANAPGPDGSRLFLFDLTKGELIASFVPEQGWAERYRFAPDGQSVELHYSDGSVVRYGRDGQMLDREAWLAGRIAAGDLQVIGGLLKEQQGEFDEALSAGLLAGLEMAAAGDHWDLRARAHRLQGELLERMGKDDEALKAYDNALAIDPQVGARRAADRLRAKLAGGAGAKKVARLGRIEAAAARLGVDYVRIALERGGPKAWRHHADDGFALVEQAALAHFQAEGWSGAASEGGLILTLIKAASFRRLSPRHADTFVEALYAQNVAFEEDRFTRGALLSAVRKATFAQIERNWTIIAAATGTTPAYYPAVTWPHVAGLFDALGPDRLAAIAERFATAPYDLRAGWPDLTLWRGTDVRFVEVKGPGDQLHASQTRLISQLLQPLGYPVALADIVAR